MGSLGNLKSNRSLGYFEFQWIFRLFWLPVNVIPSGESTGGPSEYNRQKSGQHTEQQLLTEIVDLLGEPATASNTHCTAWTLSSCALRSRKKLSDKQKAKGFVSSQVYFCAPKYILSGYFHKDNITHCIAVLLQTSSCRPCYCSEEDTWKSTYQSRSYKLSNQTFRIL